MIINRVKLVNWKNFQNVDVELSARVFVVGPNASGKSNFLDAFRFLRDIAKERGGLQYAVVDERGGVSKIRCLAARKKSEVSIEVHLSEMPGSDTLWKYELAFKHAGGGIVRHKARVIRERVWSANDNAWVLDRNENSENEDDETLSFTHLQQINANQRFREVYHFFSNLQYLHVVPQLVRDADSYMLSSQKEDFFGRNLLDRIARTNQTTRESYLKRINEFLTLAVPQLQELSFVKEENGTPHLQAKYVHWRGQGANQQERQFSDGTLRLIGFMWALLDGTETILLEEPELYLHTEIVKSLPEFLSKLQRRRGRIRQVMLTTHSYDMLSNEGIGGDEVLFLEPSQEGTSINKVSDDASMRQRLEAGFTMAETVIPRVAPREIHQISQLQYD